MSSHGRAVYGSRFTAKRALAYNMVERMLRNYDDIADAVREARAGRKRTSGISGGNRAQISDPTAQTAITNITPLSCVELPNGYKVFQPEKWLSIIARAYREFPQTEARAMRHFYTGKTAVWTAVMYSIDESTVYRIRADFRQYLVELACQYGLVKVAPAE